MTNFFGLNVTKGNPSAEVDGMVFLARTASPEQNDEVERFRRRNEEFEQNTAFPLPLRILQFLAQLGSFVLILGIFSADVTFAEGYQNAPEIYWLALICLLVWSGLFLYQHHCQKQKQGTDEYQAHIINAELILRRTMQHLSIPENAYSMDILAERYVVKNDKVKHKNTGLNSYLNMELFAFMQDGYFCLADLEHVWEIPLSSLHSMTRLKKQLCMSQWNKSESHLSEHYKPYRITTNQFGHYFSHCYQVKIQDVRGKFFLLIPEYDGEIFTQLTGLPPLDA